MIDPGAGDHVERRRGSATLPHTIHHEDKDMTTHRIGLLGSGIAGSLSPLLHETEAGALGLTRYGYELLDPAELGREVDSPATFLREAVRDGFTGFNITYPYKQQVIDGLDALHPDAEALGAVNTVVVVPGGRLVGYNTDHSGFLRGLRGTIPDADLSRVVQTGAGGAGAAVAHALAVAGAEHLTIVDLDPRRAEDLAAAVSGRHRGTRAVGLTKEASPEHLAVATGVVNASPVGMEGFPGSPVDVALLRPEAWVADVVYRPVRTELLEAAGHLGCRVVDGTQMLVAQAADTFALLTDHVPDRDRMQRHLQQVLSARAAVASRPEEHQ